jgi:hypothetical protein
LNKLPNTIALHEPMDALSFSQFGDQEAICKMIEQYFESTRTTIRNQGVVISKQVNGEIPDNPFEDRFDSRGLRKTRVSKSIISIKNDLGDDFLLCIKHPGVFTAILEGLVKRFQCYALIRNPLSVLSSWNTVETAINNGHAPAAEGLDKSLKTTLGALEHKIERQLYLMSWFYEKYKTLLPASSIIRYEDIVSSGGRALSVITPLANRLEEQFESKNKNELYDRKLMATLGEKLLNADGAFWDFYSKESVKTLIQ